VPHRKAIITLLSLCVFALGAWAQSPPQHQHAAANIIDGAVHPELIPDAVAYRLYLLTVSEGPAPLPHESRRQHSHLQKAGLPEKDILSATIILADFKTQYAALIEQYNNSPEVQNNTNDGLALFLAKRDALVQSTRDALKSSLTPAGMSSLHLHIQKEKSKMKVAAQEAQQ
jgi:hypothetical protein